jgi:hypothetical protein
MKTRHDALLLIGTLGLSACVATGVTSPASSALVAPSYDPPGYPPSVPTCLALTAQPETRAGSPTEFHYVLRNACSADVVMCAWPGIFCAPARPDSHGFPHAAPYPLPESQPCPIENILFLKPGAEVEGSATLSGSDGLQGALDVQCQFMSAGHGYPWNLDIAYGDIRSNWLRIPVAPE